MKRTVKVVVARSNSTWRHILKECERLDLEVHKADRSDRVYLTIVLPKKSYVGLTDDLARIRIGYDRNLDRFQDFMVVNLSDILSISSESIKST